jgi:protein-S-isoprenylcysteine O-methyltransferase Ste14
MTHPLPFTWPYALPFWLAFFWAFAPEFGVLRTAPKSKADAGSMLVIMVVNQLAMFLGFGLAWLRFGTMPGGIVTFAAGVALLIAGSLLRRHCFRVLGKFFTGAVAVQSDHAVVDRGAYRWVRHPSYTGGMMMFTGIGLALGNWVSLTVLAILPAAAYVYRVRVEERALLESLGAPYRAFMQTRKRFVPFVV